MVINQGDVFWVDFGPRRGSAPGYLRPAVVIQNNALNHGRLSTVIVCGITSNLKRASAMGNVLLDLDEADLPKQSIVVVSQLFTMDKSYLGDYIGALSADRVRQILDGIRLITEPLESK